MTPFNRFLDRARNDPASRIHRRGVTKKSAFPLRRAQRGEFGVFANKDRIITLLIH